MKKLLFLLPLVLLGMKFEDFREIKPSKEEVFYKNVITNQPQQMSPFCIAGTTPANWTQDNELAPYVHCATCGYGVFLGDSGKETCTFCGTKKNYESRN